MSRLMGRLSGMAGRSVGWMSLQRWEVLFFGRQADIAVAPETSVESDGLLFIIIFAHVVEGVVVNLPALVEDAILALQLKHSRDVHARSDKTLR